MEKRSKEIVERSKEIVERMTQEMKKISAMCYHSDCKCHQCKDTSVEPMRELIKRFGDNGVTGPENI